MKIDIKEIEKINLENGDVLVIKMDQRMMPVDVRASVEKMLSDVFPNNKVIIARPKDKFEVIKQEILK